MYRENEEHSADSSLMRETSDCQKGLFLSLLLEIKVIPEILKEHDGISHTGKSHSSVICHWSAENIRIIIHC